jgi:hypothetical protein
VNELDQLEKLNKAPELQRFRIMAGCPKCHHRCWRVPGFVVRWLELPWTRFKVIWCKGGMDPQQDIKMVTVMGEIQQTINMACAGIQEDHLHVQCVHCNYWFLMESYDARC